ncbi:hypothetical protein SRHO_G00205430 [Serrasalmus rhombeus]
MILERLPPGPSPAPVLGNVLQLRVKEPYKYYIELSKKYGSIFTVWLLNTPVVVISGYQALKDTMIGLGEEFSGRSDYPLLRKVTSGYGLLISSGDRWKQLRRFSITTMKNFGMGRRSIEDKVKEEARCLKQTFSTFGDSAFNPKDLITEAVSKVICSVMYGQKLQSGDPQLQLLLRAINAYFGVLSSPLGQLYNIFPGIFGLFSGQLRDVFAIVEEAKASFKIEVEARMKTLDHSLLPRDFIEAFLIRMEEEKHNPNTEFNLNNLLCTMWNLLSAGSETTSSTLRHSLLLMMKHPDVQDQSVAEVNKANQVVFSQTSEDHLFISRGYKGAADNRTTNSVCAETMSVRYSVEEAVELIFSDVQQDNSDSEEEVEDVSEEEDGEEYNPEHGESSSEEENHEAERETFLSKNGKITWSSAAYDQHSRHAEQNVIKMTPGPTRYAISHAHDIVSTFYLFIRPAIEKIILEMTNLEGSQCDM